MMQSAPNIKFGINTVISDSNFDLFEINDFFYNYLTENNLDKSKFGLGFILGRNHDYENTHNSAMHVISDENLPKFKKILKRWDKVVLSKIILSNFRPKQPNELIGGPRASIFELFIAIPSRPNLTGLNRPLNPFFHPLTLPGYPLVCCLFSEN